jgi:Protein of unknown function (DUF3365)
MNPAPALAPMLRRAGPRAARLGLAVALAVALIAGGCVRRVSQPLDAYRMAADAVHTVIAADRGVYAKKVVERLALEEKVIGASEHWNDEHALPLPAQMLRMSAEQARQKSTGMWYALISSWPLNKQNGPKTPTETAALEAVQAHPDIPYYGEETVRGRRFFTAVYADRAVSKACVSCHNHHPDSPRRDFVLNETMGALVVRFAM